MEEGPDYEDGVAGDGHDQEDDEEETEVVLGLGVGAEVGEDCEADHDEESHPLLVDGEATLETRHHYLQIDSQENEDCVCKQVDAELQTRITVERKSREY